MFTGVFATSTRDITRDNPCRAVTAAQSGKTRTAENRVYSRRRARRGQPQPKEQNHGETESDGTTWDTPLGGLEP